MAAVIVDAVCHCCHGDCAVAGAFSSLLRELVAEFTLTDNPANTTTSLLRSLCHSDDSIILGTWLQETDHKSIEDQVGVVTSSRRYHCPILATWLTKL